MRKIFIDENISEHYCPAFNLFEKPDTKIEVRTTILDFGRGVQDKDLIEPIAKLDGILLTKDKDFKRMQLLIDLIKQHKLGVVFFRHPAKLSKWEEIAIFTKVWPQIRELAILYHRPPYLQEFTHNCKLKELTL